MSADNSALPARDIAKQVNRYFWRQIPPALRVRLRQEYRRCREWDKKYPDPIVGGVLAARARCEAYRNGMIDALNLLRDGAP